jgi:hypothetical protein
MTDNQNLALVSELRTIKTPTPSVEFLKTYKAWQETNEWFNADGKLQVKLPTLEFLGLDLDVIAFDKAEAEKICFKKDIIEPNIFLIRSVLVVQMHLVLAYYSKKLNCDPDIHSVLAVGNETVKKDINDRKKACSIELDDESLWLHLKSDKWKQAENDDQRKQLFITWWYEINSPTYQSIDKSVVERIFIAYKQLKRYQQMESPRCYNTFDPNSSIDVQSAICGFFRRASQGLMHSRSYDYNDFPNRSTDMLLSAKPSVIKKLSGANGTLTPFGQTLMTTLDLHLRHNRFVDNRQQGGTETKSKSPLETKVFKRGRARLK